MEYTLDLTVLKVIHRRNMGLSTIAGNVFGFTDSQSLTRLCMFMEHMMILDAAGFKFEDNPEKSNELFAMLIYQIWGKGYIPKDTFKRPSGFHNNHMLSHLYNHLDEYKRNKDPIPIFEWYRKHVTYKGNTVFKLEV